jgi:nickel/cobalt exporter
MLELQRWLYAEAGAQLKGLANGIAPLNLLTGIRIAVLFGIVHAFMPGHGKTVLVSPRRPSKVIAGLSASVILVLTHVGSAVVLVLTGFIIIRGTIGCAGRAQEFENTSSAFIVLIGLRRGNDHSDCCFRGYSWAVARAHCILRKELLAPASASGKHRANQRGCDYLGLWLLTSS